VWRWYIDTTLEYSYYWPNLGYYDNAGLESWDQYGSIPYATHNGMVKQVNWSGWTSWQASPSSWHVGASQMAGNYIDANDAWSSEN
jgi:hypothetical protein